VIYDGRGDSVLEIAKPAGTDVVLIDFRHAGGSNFAVKSLDASLGYIDLLVNTIGNYQGRTLVDAEVGESTKFLEITAGGDWHVEVHPLTAARTFVDAIDGQGDDVVTFLGDPSVGQLTHGGTSNFAVWHYTTDGSDLLVNEIGGYDGSVPIRGAGVLEITADGPWRIAT
jgi:hypothetical protein